MYYPDVVLANILDAISETQP